MKDRSFAQNLSDSNSVSVEFLIADSETALILLDLADTTKIAENRSRRIQEAQQAYETILSFAARVNPTAEQSETLTRNMKTLKARFKELNVPVE